MGGNVAFYRNVVDRLVVPTTGATTSDITAIAAAVPNGAILEAGPPDA